MQKHEDKKHNHEEAKEKLVLEPEVETVPGVEEVDARLKEFAQISDSPTSSISEVAEVGSKVRRIRPPAVGPWIAASFVLGISLGVVSGWGMWEKQLLNKLVPAASGPEPTRVVEGGVSPTLAPTPTAAAAMKREDLKIKVLNGTGKSGVAAKGKDYLEGLGYKDVQTGNAKRSDYGSTEVIFNKSKTGYWTLLQEDLGKNYELAAGFSTDDELTGAAGVDAIVVVGAK